VASERESQQSRRLLQAKEVGVFALLACLRVSMVLFAGALASNSDSAAHDLKAALLQVATGTRDHLLVLSVLILKALALTPLTLSTQRATRCWRAISQASKRSGLKPRTTAIWAPPVPSAPGGRR
jgi:hypothetical protein